MLARIESEIQARTASEARLRQFVADASHELRTPLTTIRGFAELYRAAGRRPDRRWTRRCPDRGGIGADGAAGRRPAAARELDEQRPLQRKPVDVLQIAADTIRDAHARVPDRPVRLDAFGPDDGEFEPVTVLGDEHRLRQVATNLVNNALVHTPPEARITIRVGRWSPPRVLPPSLPSRRQHPVMAPVRDADQAAYAVLEVSDTGPGIPREHAERVFERLYRVESSRARGKSHAGGSGLGLSIVAAIVQSHGGEWSC